MLKKYPQVCERFVLNYYGASSTRTHPNGRPKEDEGEGNCTIDVIFEINRNFLKKCFENRKNSHEQNVFHFQFYISSL